MASVRQLNAEDAKAYMAFRSEMLLDSPSSFMSAPGDDRMEDFEEVTESLSSGEHAIFAAEDGALLVASAGVMRVPRLKCRHRAGIWGVFTSPSHRGRGLARAVVGAAIEHARRWEGVRVVGLSVSVEAPAARRLYESLGFVAWGTEPAAMCIDGQELDEIYMALRL